MIGRENPASAIGAAALLCTLAALVAGCGLVDAARQTNAAELVGLAPDEPCVIERNEVGDLDGAFLRQAGESARFEIFYVRGRPGSQGLPRRLTFDDTRIRRLSDDGDGTVSGGRASTAAPIPGLGGGAALAYRLSYEAGDVTYSGALTLGPIPAPAAIPTAGRAVFTGAARMTATLAGADGAAVSVPLTGDATLQVGYGSGLSVLRVENIAAEGGAPPFDVLEWGPLGFCAARIVSTGAGTFRLTDATGARLRPFAAPAGAEAETPTRARIESALYAGGEDGAPPAAAGGVFLIQGDGGVLQGAFTAALGQ